MKNIYVLPTDKISRLAIENKELILVDEINNYKNAQNIYVTNDEVIEEWYIYKGKLLRASINHSKYEIIYGKPVVLTTDQDLIKDSIQTIPDEFLNWFIKNPSCEKVNIQEEKHLICNHCDSLYSSFSDGIHCDVCVRLAKPIVKVLGYKIIIPQEEPKQLSVEEITELVFCNKQETLEEAAEKLYPIFQRSTPFGSKFPWTPHKERDAFTNGAKWQKEHYGLMEIELRHTKTLLASCEKALEERDKQQKGSYSEEEVYHILCEHTAELFKGSKLTLSEWFEKFKKK